MSVPKVAVLVGSLRRDSLNRKMAAAMIELAQPSLQLEIVDISQLPLYNEDDDQGKAPPAYEAFRNRMWSSMD